MGACPYCGAYTLRWDGTRSGSGRPTVDVYVCTTCGKESTKDRS